MFVGWACTENPDVENLVPDQRNVTITANTVASRASYDPNTKITVWESTDVIGCFAEHNNNIRFTATNITANEFSSLVSKDPTEFFFYFPYNEKATMSDGVLKSELSATQTLRAGSYAPSIPLVSYTTSLDDVTFSNLCGVIAFTVRSNIDRVLTSFAFESNDGSAVAGEYTVDMTQSEMTMTLGSTTTSKVIMIRIHGLRSLSSG